jgi:hypothetical protein
MKELLKGSEIGYGERNGGLNYAFFSAAGRHDYENKDIDCSR